MTRIQDIATEALKKISDGTLKEWYNGYHLWWQSPVVFQGSENPWVCNWGADLLGSLFIGYMKFKKFDIDDSGGNWWSNSLVIRAISEFNYFKSEHQRYRCIGFYNNGSTYTQELDIYDRDFKENCKYKLIYLLHSLRRDGNITTISWKENGIYSP